MIISYRECVCIMMTVQRFTHSFFPLCSKISQSPIKMTYCKSIVSLFAQKFVELLIINFGMHTTTHVIYRRRKTKKNRNFCHYTTIYKWMTIINETWKLLPHMRWNNCETVSMYVFIGCARSRSLASWCRFYLVFKPHHFISLHIEQLWTFLTIPNYYFIITWARKIFCCRK